MEFAAAADAHAEGERRDRAGDPEGALAAFRAAIALDPQHGPALNHAGWLLTTKLRAAPGAMGEGIDLLRAAIAASPDDTRAYYNLADACAALQQPEEALPAVDAALARTPAWPELLNLRAWLRGVVGDDPRSGLADLEAALRLRWRYGDAYLNRARMLRKLGEYEGAERAAELALHCECWRPAEAHHHLGELCERRGHLRRALGRFRRAAELGAGDLQAETLAGVNRCGASLLHRQAFLLHALDEGRLALQRERHPGERPPLQPLAALVRRCAQQRAAERAADATLAAIGEAGLLAAETCFKGQALLPAYADQSPAVAVEMLATGFTGARHDALRRLGEDIRRAWFALYEELLDREEPTPDPYAELAAIERLGAERRFIEAIAAMHAIETTCHREGDHMLLGRGLLAERLGDRARLHGEEGAALSLYAIAERDYAEYASWSTSSGEGAVRAADVKRVRARLRGPPAEV